MVLYIQKLWAILTNLRVFWLLGWGRLCMLALSI